MRRHLFSSRMLGRVPTLDGRSGSELCPVFCSGKGKWTGAGKDFACAVTVRGAASPSACLPARFTPLLWSGNPSFVLLSPAVDHKVLALDSHTMVSCTNDPVP